MAALAVAMVAIGCSAGQQSGPYALETAGNKLVLTIYAYGGMTASNYQWAPQEARFSLYGNGRVLQSCLRDESNPSLLPCLNETHVSPDEIQRIVTAADKAGLLSDAAFDDYLWTDDETTVFKTTVGGSTHKVEAYGLSPDYPSTDAGVKLARMRLLAFRASMTDLGDFLGRKVETQPYAATSLRVQCSPADAQSSEAQLRPWPVAADPGIGGHGLTLTGDDMVRFVAAAGGATVFTVWTVPSGYCHIDAHPVLPDE